MIERLLRTAFFTALLSYLGFIFLDYLEPGFVSYAFSTHLIGGLALIFGVAWAHVAKRTETRWPWRVVLLAVGLVLGYVVWQEGETFGGLRLLLSLTVAVLPTLCLSILSVKEH